VQFPAREYPAFWAAMSVSNQSLLVSFICLAPGHQVKWYFLVVLDFEATTRGSLGWTGTGVLFFREEFATVA